MKITCPNCKTPTDYEWGYDIPDDEFAVLECPTCGIDWRHTADEDVRVYWYANRWHDENGVHHFGVQSTAPTIELARQDVQFNCIAVPVNLVYAAQNIDDLFEFMGDFIDNSEPGDDLYTVDG
jgi:hypothetical protein